MKKGLLGGSPRVVTNGADQGGLEHLIRRATFAVTFALRHGHAPGERACRPKPLLRVAAEPPGSLVVSDDQPPLKAGL
jgi:hypothetical protein